MKIPSPYERLAGCVWLPRILAKARMIQRGELPAAYAEMFCFPKGVDGFFLANFGLDRPAVERLAALPDAQAEKEFLALAGKAGKSIEDWNHTALNLGRPGFPMADRLPIAKATKYQRVDSSAMTTVFEVLEADDQLG